MLASTPTRTRYWRPGPPAASDEAARAPTSAWTAVPGAAVVRLWSGYGPASAAVQRPLQRLARQEAAAGHAALRQGIDAPTVRAVGKAGAVRGRVAAIRTAQPEEAEHQQAFSGIGIGNRGQEYAIESKRKRSFVGPKTVIPATGRNDGVQAREGTNSPWTTDLEGTSSSSDHPTHLRALRNMRIHGDSSPQLSGAHECTTPRNTRSACGIRTVKRPSSVVTEVRPPGEPFGLNG